MRGRRLVKTIAAVLICFTLSVPRPASAQGLDEATAVTQKAIQLYDQGRYSEAIPLAQRALAIREKALGPYHPDVAVSLNYLALLYDKQGRYADAESLYKRSLGIREKALGPDHPDVAVSLNNLADALPRAGSIPRRRAALEAVVSNKRKDIRSRPSPNCDSADQPGGALPGPRSLCRS